MVLTSVRNADTAQNRKARSNWRGLDEENASRKKADLIMRAENEQVCAALRARGDV